MDREQLLYIGGRGTYSLLQFVALVVFSHLLAPGQYGLYAIGVAMAYLGNAVLFRWIRQSVLRFSSPGNPRKHQVLGHARARFLSMAFLAASIGVPVSGIGYLFGGGQAALLVLGTLVVVIGQGFFEIHLEYRRSVNESKLYIAGLVTKAALLLVIGTMLGMGLGSFVGPLGGVAVGFFVGGVVLGGRIPTSPGSSPLSRHEQERVRNYGVPLAVMFGFTYAMSQMDRVLLGLLDSSAATGVYAVAYDIGREAIFVPLLAVSLPYFPAVVDVYDGDMSERVVAILNENVDWLLALGIPAVVGISLVGEGLTTVLLDPAYAEVGGSLIPLVAAGAFLLAFQEFIYNTPYMLREVTGPLSVIHGVGAGFNLLANIILIPPFGVYGAAGATVATYLITFLIKAHRTRRVLPLEIDARLVTGILSGTAAMAALLIFLPAATDVTSLLTSIVSGLLVYLCFLVPIWWPVLQKRASTT